MSYKTQSISSVSKQLTKWSGNNCFLYPHSQWYFLQLPGLPAVVAFLKQNKYTEEMIEHMDTNQITLVVINMYPFRQLKLLSVHR